MSHDNLSLADFALVNQRVCMTVLSAPNHQSMLTAAALHRYARIAMTAVATYATFVSLIPDSIPMLVLMIALALKYFAWKQTLHISKMGLRNSRFSLEQTTCICNSQK